MSEKYDSFQPRRATSIDGFLTGSSQAPRRPQFRASNPLTTGITAAPSQGRPVGLPDMPKRTLPSPVLSEAQLLPQRSGNRLDGSGQNPGASEEGISRRKRRKAEKDSRKAEKKRDKRRKKGGKVKKAFKLLGVLLLCGVLLAGFHFYRDIAKLTGNKNPLSLLDVFHPSTLKNQDGRVNILVAGNSSDDPGHDGANLTDSIMILSINTKNNTALMLSIPRDLWVHIPGYGYAKINSAYTDGGMGTLGSAVENVTGMSIDYSVLVGYGAFRDLVNAVGGITINIQSTDHRGIYDPSLDYTTRSCCALAKYPNGPVTLNGKQALNLARARGDAYGSYGFNADFTRTDNQRKMVMAIKDKVATMSTISNPLKITSLVDAVSNNITTDLQLSDMETLYYYMKKIDDNKIASYNINTLKGTGTTMLQNYAASDGESALVPAAGVEEYSAIQVQIQKILTAGPLISENAAIEVLNGTDSVGLAKQQSNKITDQGASVVGMDDAPQNQAQTTIVDNSKGQKPNTLAYLKRTFNATVVTNQTLTADYPSADFILLLGQNAVPQATTSRSTAQ